MSDMTLARAIRIASGALDTAVPLRSREQEVMVALMSELTRLRAELEAAKQEIADVRYALKLDDKHYQEYQKEREKLRADAGRSKTQLADLKMLAACGSRARRAQQP